MNLYPLKFHPIYKYKMWGGEKLKNYLGKSYEETNIGESWELSDVPENKSIIANGAFEGKTLSEILEKYPTEILGQKVFEQFGAVFPLLLKFIDAKTPLSIQVHPNDEIAQKRENSFGKNEMWYIMQADENAELIVGFKNKETTETYLEAIDNGSILNILNTIEVKEGDTLYIPAGRVHAIGAGVLLAEIQQTSDITYRIYDYDRVDQKTGKTRQLHTKESVDVIDFEVKEDYRTQYNLNVNEANTLVYSPYFKTDIISLSGQLTKDYSQKDSFTIYMCVEGSLELFFKDEKYTLKMGEVILLPNSIDTLIIIGEAKFIEVYM